jgi:hypothetical protein
LFPVDQVEGAYAQKRQLLNDVTAEPADANYGYFGLT